MAIALTQNEQIVLASIEREDLPEAQLVFDQTPRYHNQLHGHPADPDMASRCFNHRPPKTRHGLRVWKYFTALLPPRSDQIIGVLDVFVGFPRYDVATMATLLIRESHQRQGLGAAALNALVDWMRARHPAVLRLDASITDDNIAATRFLLANGFQRTNSWDRVQIGDLDKRIIRLERPLTPRSDGA